MNKRRGIRGDYLSTCDNCEWYGLFPNAASVRNAQRNGKRHALRLPGHRVSVINLQHLETVTIFEFGALDQVEDPPF